MNDAYLFEYGGEMGARMRDTDWSATPVGAVERWPESLATVVAVCLRSRFPMVVWWGREHYTMFYNDAYIPALGKRKHPGWLGRSGRECWNDIWCTVGPMIDSVFTTGLPTWSEDLQLFLDRDLPREESYFTFSYSAVPSTTGYVDGVFCACFETTQRLVGERQLALMRTLASATGDARTFRDACTLSAESLATDPWDLPFALIYLVDEATSTVRLAASSGVEMSQPAVPTVAALSDQSVWPFATVLARQTPQIVDLRSIRGELSVAPWGEAPQHAVAAVIRPSGPAGQTGILIAGLNPLRPLDANGRHFVSLIAAQIGAALGNAQAYEDERRRAEALAEIDRAKTAFFANISHEFRTPLTLMLSPIEDMLAGRMTPGPEPLALVRRNGVRLMKLVNTLLDFSRIEAGRIEASYQLVDIAALTADVASMFRSTIERAGLQFTLDAQPISDNVYVDLEMWEKIVLNLLSNAFKFTFSGEIRVSLVQDDASQVRLAVSDTGIGIADGDRARIFERFHRIHGARSRTHEGSGIGLALVAELVKLHGGSATVESALGTGSVFVVTIPTGKEHLPAARIGAPRSLASTRSGVAYIDEADNWIGPPADDSLPAIDARRRIVLADDNPDMRGYLTRLLGARWNIEAVADGDAALAAVRRQPPALILTDVMMPGLDGFGLLRAIRNDPATRSIPVIMLSARAGDESRTEGINAGADDYLVKPFSSRELIARVAACLARSSRASYGFDGMALNP
jgi:signal transduction histidine kinase/ActR/RegA family two-component response regulator